MIIQEFLVKTFRNFGKNDQKILDIYVHNFDPVNSNAILIAIT